jgi:hypothetical protein
MFATLVMSGLNNICAPGRHHAYDSRIAGHKNPGNDNSPRHVEETRQYIRDFIRLNDSTKTVRELYDKMLEL